MHTHSREPQKLAQVRIHIANSTGHLHQLSLGRRLPLRLQRMPADLLPYLGYFSTFRPTPSAFPPPTTGSLPDLAR